MKKNKCFQILISSVDDNIDLNKLKNNKFLVINQLINKKKSKFKKNKHIFSYIGKGLSKSRNKAIEKSSCDFCLISDDDVFYIDNIDEIIITYFKKYPEADIITFQVITPEKKLYKNYSKKPFWHNIRTIMKVSSIEIAFKRESIIKNNIKFDENFGLGEIFPTGEEIIFLSDALKRGLKIKYIPIPIVIHKQESSGKNYNNFELIKAKGAMFYRIFGIKSYLISLLFALKKYKLSNYNFFVFYKFMLKGIKEYKEITNAK